MEKSVLLKLDEYIEQVRLSLRRRDIKCFENTGKNAFN